MGKVINPPDVSECQICFAYTKLVKSHIIPRAISRVLTRNNGPSLVVPSAANARPKRIQDGLYARFCCATCEKLFGPVDHAFADFYRQLDTGAAIGRDPTAPIARIHEDANPLMISGFFASLLLRGAISGHDFFARVKLNHATRRRVASALRSGLLSQDTGFRVLLTRVTGQLGLLITDPHEHIVRGHHGFAVRLPGLLAIVFPHTTQLALPFSGIAIGGDSNVIVMEREHALPGEEEFVIEAAARHAAHLERMFPGDASPTELS
jgi:hypothetical protein